MKLNESTWHLVRKVPKIIGFIGGTSEKPLPITKKEIKNIKKRLQKIGNKPRPKIIFEPGETVRVNEGPFSDFHGIVEEIDYEKNRIKLLISIFGRSTPVELNFSQIEKS